MIAARRVDGRLERGSRELRADVVIVGSGPAGSAAARELAAAGASVVVVEAGPWVRPDEFPRSGFDAMARTYRAMGASIVVGAAPSPYLQGKLVGGSSPINGAICWRLPRGVHDAWLRDDPALADALPWEVVEAVTDELERRLGVAPTDAAIAGPKNVLMARGADALGLAHRPIRRNVVACDGLGRCLQGCPRGRKQSVDLTLLADAEADGAVVVSSVSVERVLVERGRAVGVVGRADGGGEVTVRVTRAVVLAASAVQTPALLLTSGLHHGPVGENFQCHPGVSMAGRFPQRVAMWEGATQGHEVTGLTGEGLKFETLGFDLGVLAVRLDGVGRTLAAGVDDLAHYVDWGAAVRAEARGRVRVVGGHPVVTFSPTAEDVARYRRGLRVLGELMLAAGAEFVLPGVRGAPRRIADVAALAALEQDGPRSPAAYQAAITHMFGTCRMGADPRIAVVRPDFRHHAVDRLYVADSSVFPTNLGVNPQVPIMAVAALCARAVLRAAPSEPRAAAPAAPAAIAAAPVPLAASPATRSPAMPTPASRPALTLPDLMAMDRHALHRVLCDGHPLDPDALAGRQFLGVDLSLPDWARRLLWHTFRKAFVRDPDTGEVRGWNVRMEQHGVDGPRVPVRDRRGRAVTFGHYRVRSAHGLRFPGGWRGAHYLDYAAGGNLPLDLARFGRTPLVAVNAGSQALLLGWEAFQLGPAALPMPLYWALRDEGPVDEVVPPPRPPRG